MKGGFGNPECWSGPLSFLMCCSIRAFGPGGNPACWEGMLCEGEGECFGSEPGQLNFDKCCQPIDWPEVRENAGDIILRAHGDFKECIISLSELVHRVDMERHALGERVLKEWEADLLGELNSLTMLWRSEQLAELMNNLPNVLSSYEAEFLRPKVEEPNIAILMGCTPETAGGDLCRLGANLWECYAQRHGYHFIFDTNEYPSYPQKFRFGGGARGAAALDVEFDESAVRFLEEEPLALQIGSDALDFKWWQRWYATRRHLPAHDLILVVDPDTGIFPSCTDVGLHEALGLSANVSEWPGVIARDPRDGEDLNGGVFAVTRSPWGFLFLELLLARSRWPIDVAGGGGWCHARQSAEHETLLEVIALAHAALNEEPLDYTSECMMHAVPQVASRREGGEVAGCIWPAYLRCFKKNAQRFLGPPGHRAGSHVRLIDPQRADINYRPWSNEPRYRAQFLDSDAVPPVQNAAFLWHYVGIPGKVANMMRDFGLSSLSDTFDCGLLQRSWASADPALPACKLGGSATPCPYDDSLLMPHIFGC